MIANDLCKFSDKSLAWDAQLDRHLLLQQYCAHIRLSGDRIFSDSAIIINRPFLLIMSDSTRY